MKIKTYHVDMEKDEGTAHIVPAIADKLREIGLTPVLNDTFSNLNATLTSVGLPEFPFLVDKEEFEILVHESSNTALLLRLSNEDDFLPPTRRRLPGPRPEPATGLDFLFVTSREMTLDENNSEVEANDKAYTVIQEVTGKILSEHSRSEIQLKQSLQSRFGDLSPNGKLLTKPEILQACRTLTDDRMRKSIAPVANTFGTSPTPLSGLEKLDAFSGSSDELTALLDNADVMVSHYSISCSQCETSQLTFHSRAKAEEIIADSGRRCGTCGEQALAVIDTYKLNENVDRALRQGLWLEAFVGDIVRPYTDAVWCGQMAKNDEIDVLCVYAESLIMIECKDKNVGASDAYVTAAKAQNIGADQTVIVTTKEVHQNVYDVVEEMSSTSREHQIDIIVDSTAARIRSELEDTLERTANSGLRKWMINGLGLPFYSLRRFPMA